jgi:hypothetical protein
MANRIKSWSSFLGLAVALSCATANAASDESTTVGGKLYADLTNLDLKNDGVDAASNGTGIDVKRFYLVVNHSFDSTWSANLTTDFNYVGNDGETQVFVKKAYVQAKLSDALFARLGSADLPWIPFVEDLYGYRYVENTLIDRLKFGTSADWGVHAGGKVADGLFGYAASVVNGAGYKNPTRSKSMDFEGRVSLTPITGLTFGAGFYNGKLGKDIEGTTTPVEHTAERWDAVAAYVNKSFRVGAEYFQAKNWNQVTAAPTDKSDGYSAWASFNFSDALSVFGRYDSAKPKKDLASGLKDEYYNLGVAFHARKNVDFALAYKYDKVDNGAISTSNGTIGGLNSGKYEEIGLWTQVSF